MKYVLTIDPYRLTYAHLWWARSALFVLFFYYMSGWDWSSTPPARQGFWASCTVVLVVYQVVSGIIVADTKTSRQERIFK